VLTFCRQAYSVRSERY